MNAEGKLTVTITADDIDLSNVDMELHHRIRNMLRIYGGVCNGRLGYINVVQHALYLKKLAKLAKSASYRSGLTARRLETLGFQQQLKVTWSNLHHSSRPQPCSPTLRKMDAYSIASISGIRTRRF